MIKKEGIQKKEDREKFYELGNIILARYCVPLIIIEKIFFQNNNDNNKTVGAIDESQIVLSSSVPPVL